MAASGGGISGVAVAVATAGALLAYAGYRGISPITALRDLASGRPPGVSSPGAGLLDSIVSGPAGAVAEGYQYLGTQIVANAMKYRGDRYSQARRNQPGYSDCSSFVGKALKATGIKPPAGSTTASYFLSKEWREVPLAQARAGDIVVSATAALVGAHMVLVTGPGQAIGQQNSRDNVETGRIEDLMAGSRYRYIAKRFVGTYQPPPREGVASV